MADVDRSLAAPLHTMSSNPSRMFTPALRKKISPKKRSRQMLSKIE